MQRIQGEGNLRDNDDSIDANLSFSWGSESSDSFQKMNFKKSKR